MDAPDGLLQYCPYFQHCTVAKSTREIKANAMIFGWFKKRALNEQTKLLFENIVASGLMSVVLGRYGKQELANALQRFHIDSRRIANSVGVKELVAPQDTKTLLEINEMLRRLHRHEFRDVCSELSIPTLDFDSEFKPDNGWDHYHANYNGWRDI